MAIMHPVNALNNRTTSLVVAEVSFFLVINMAALFGNLLISVAFFKNKHLRSATNMFVLTLAFSDIIMSLTAMPLSEIVLIAGDWIFGNLLCHFQGFLVHFLAFFSLQMMALTAVNRYFRVLKPDVYKKVFTTGYTALMIVAGGLFSIVLLASVTFAQHGNLFVFHPGKVICVTLYHTVISSQIYTIFASVFFVFLPAVVITWCYVQVFRAIRKHYRQLAARKASTVSLNSLSPAEIVVTRTVFAIVLCFYLCWIPCIVIDFVDILRDDWFERRVYLGYTYLAYTSSAINPIIYGVMNRSFRLVFSRMLSCR